PGWGAGLRATGAIPTNVRASCADPGAEGGRVGAATGGDVVPIPRPVATAAGRGGQAGSGRSRAARGMARRATPPSVAPTCDRVHPWPHLRHARRYHGSATLGGFALGPVPLPGRGVAS